MLLTLVGADGDDASVAAVVIVGCGDTVAGVAPVMDGDVLVVSHHCLKPINENQQQQLMLFFPAAVLLYF